MGNGQGF
ncbi:unnamed protein product [Cuscuta europaea]|nr:unnamed protein product [Cuscuta europaea]